MTTSQVTATPSVSLSDLGIIARGQLKMTPSGVIKFRVVVDASAKDATAFAFARQDNGSVLYSGTTASGIKARLKTLQAHPVVNKSLYAKLSPHVDANIVVVDASAVMTANKLTGADARHAMIAAWGSVGNRAGLAPVALQAPAPVTAEDDTDAGDLPDADTLAAMSQPGDEQAAAITVGAEEEPTSEEPAKTTTDEPAAEEPAPEQSTDDSDKSEEPAAEQVAAEETVADEQPATVEASAADVSVTSEDAPGAEPVVSTGRKGRRGHRRSHPNQNG